MGVVLVRFIAVLLLVIPGAAATVGFLKMKDSVFDYFSGFGNDDGVVHSFAWGQFLLGVILFIAGVGFIGGWIFFRDRKRNYVAPRFRKKRPRPERQNIQ
ncbi:DUF2627 domain-containing protein [Paenibacillus pinihumi]|uniref:DUF2627 domain-containing protein n=1 Tax=Paenibacillus pinihumi TaxID=669462 RepID=UPI00040809F6|nr:DUF2627 domain-containing protein [Paenibacillus pinihumi]